MLLVFENINVPLTVYYYLIQSKKIKVKNSMQVGDVLVLLFSRSWSEATSIAWQRELWIHLKK